MPYICRNTVGHEALINFLNAWRKSSDMDAQGLKFIFKTQPLVTKAQTMQSIAALLEHM